MRKIKGMAAVMLTVLLLITGLTGCSGADSEEAVLKGDLTKKTVVTVNDEKITMDTMMYYIMEQEAEYSYYDTYYMASYGTSYWDLNLDEDGTTVRQKMKEYVMETAQLYEIFYQEAEKQGYELTEDDIDEAGGNAYSIWSSMSDDQKKITGLTEESLTEIFKKISLATKYYDEVETKLEVDEETVSASVKKEDYREYSIEMMCLDKMEETDEDGNMADVPAKELKAARNRMKQYEKKIEKGKSLDTVLQENEERIYVQSMTFMEGDQSLNETLETAALKLDDDEHTGIIDTDDGYVIIRMVDRNSTESYERAVQTAIEDAETEEFEKLYEEIKKSYQIEVKEDLWDRIEIGNLTIDDEEETVEVTNTLEEQD